MTIDQINQTRIGQLHPKLRVLAERFVIQCRQSGFDVLITQGLRTFAEQDALFVKRPRVTNAKAGHSYHNYGLAFDFVPLTALGKADWDSKHPEWDKAGAIGESLGLEWGAHFHTLKDIPHFQLTAGLTIKECLSLSKGGQDIGAVWAEASRRFA